MQWPGAYCEQTSAGCCKPTTGVSPARDFYITGFTVLNATTDAAVTGCSNKVPYDPNLVRTYILQLASSIIYISIIIIMRIIININIY